MTLHKQILALTGKTLRIILIRHSATTIYSALVLPIILSVYLGLGQKLNQPDNHFGIGSSYSIRSLNDALSQAGGGRDTVIFVNSGHTGGDISRVISSVSDIVTKAGKNATTITDEANLPYECRSSIRGTSNCFGAVVFYSSPKEGSAGFWNYTLRADGGLANGFDVGKDGNDAQVYVLPLQRAVDAAIVGSKFPSETDQYAYTAMTEDERQAKLRRDFQHTFIQYLSIAFILALIGVSYHLPGFIATEREKGISQLIDAMMPTKVGWHRQFARLVSNYIAFALVYFPGWIAASVVTQVLTWKNTSMGIVLIFFLLGGIAMTSMSLLGASFFKKAQLSGVVTSVVWIILGIVAQVIPNPSTAAVTILSLLFTPCNFVFFVIYIARFEEDGQGASLVKPSPTSNSSLPGIVHWIFFIIQMLVYPFIAAFIEQYLHGVSTGTRTSSPDESKAPDAVRIENMTKIYRPSWIRKLFSFVSPPRPEVVAVDNLTLTAKRGEILALLGANGSGKSSTLDSIAGINDFTSGQMSVDMSGGLGYAPQHNVMWDELSVEEHIKLFSQIKCPSKVTSKEEIAELINAIGLSQKAKALSKTLSGGQKRKLQLGMMLIGGSSVCCVDEVSSGIDPLSRKKIWDILLAERGTRTLILTTHFLDEADLLADRIAILSRGTLRAEGSSAELKDKLGKGYRIHVVNARDIANPPDFEDVEKKVATNNLMYIAQSSAKAAQVIRTLEASGIAYKYSGPTIEDVFLHLADEVRSLNISNEKSWPLDSNVDASANGGLALLEGKQTGMVTQTLVLLRKRFTVFKTNWLPYFAAFILPIIAAAIIQLLIRNDDAVGCSPVQRSSISSDSDFFDLVNAASIAGGPASQVNASLIKPIRPSNSIPLHTVDSLSSLNSYIETNRNSIEPGGLWTGDSNSKPTLAFRADNFSMYTAVLSQSFLDTMLANTTIATQYREFDYPVAPSTGRGLQLVVYFAVACSIFPGLFGLYPNAERVKNIRSLQYSSGVRTLPVWLAHIIFDFGIILVSMILAAMALVVSSDSWYNGGLLFPVFILYGLVSILISYFVSLICASALATFAGTAVIQGLGFAIYVLAYLFILTYSEAASTDKNILIAHWVIAAVFPTGSLIRALMVGQNIFSTSCDGDQLQSNPGALTAYGGPILYLALQCILWFTIIVLVESGAGRFATEKAHRHPEIDDPEIAEELTKVDGNTKAAGLNVVHLTKSFGDNTAVDNVTYGVPHGEVFALLGPNGAGKSTSISLIRGDIAPSRNGGDVFIEGASVLKQRATARAKLGVCPQFDAIDNMTVREHLVHYTRLRGITDINTQVPAVIRAVGLDDFADRMAHTLSGGNKRKLSLGIALTGNPPVIILDEPSSGLDAASKRIMWRTLETIVPGRSILLTTHSMEEADALANRAGIMARRMLAIGTSENLCHRFGDTLHVHLVSKTAPHSSTEEMEQLSQQLLSILPDAAIDTDTYHGQMRFSIPTAAVPGTRHRHNDNNIQSQGSTTQSAMGRLLVTLEENREAMGIAHFTVSPTTLNEVFLNIVGQHDVQEEGERKDGRPEKPWYRAKWFWGFEI